jgi:pyruvate/2-oxoglutarate dehydrogenase complex dihydrolipoamide acyltransferase (E2) component
MTSTGEAKSKDEAGVTVTSSEGAPSPLGEEAQDGAVATAGGVWNTMPDPEDRSIRGLFASLRWRLLRLEETWEGGDQFVWTLKSSQSNIDNLCDSLFGDAGDPEADDWRRMVGSSLDKARRKLEDKLRALGGQGGNAATGKPAYVHGRALLDVYSELKEAVAGFEEGKETEVEGWDSLDFPVRELTSAPTTVAATSAASVSEPGAVLPSAEGAEPAVAGKEDRPEGAEEENREHGEENGGTRESGGGDRAREVGDAHGSGEESPPAGVAPEPSEEGKHVRPEQSGKEEDVGKEKLEPVSTKLSGGLLEEGPALPSVSKAAAADSDPLLKACVDSENGPSQGGSPLSSRDSYSKASTQGQLEKCEPGAD